ncbi:MAG: hypothetical protein IJ057_06305 [Bacteroidales bacterium]|nr:hypothetical protein [Bacteroidales bacterium]
MTFLIIVVLLFIGFALIGFHNAEKEKQKEAERQARREEIRKKLDEERQAIQKELEETRLRDMENMVLYENSTLGRYTFNVKGLTHRSQTNQEGAKLLRTCCPLRLQHDEGNEYDTFAMRVYSVTGDFFLGYVERSKSMALWSVKDNIKACMISSYFNGDIAPYITATAYFQKEKDGVLQPYTLGAKKVDMPLEINSDNTVQTYRSYISKALKKEDWNERTFNEVQARADFLLSNGIKMSERVKEELRARGVRLKETGEF